MPDGVTSLYIYGIKKFQKKDSLLSSLFSEANRKMSKYINLAKVNTNYAMRMNRLSNRIFGEVARPTNRQSMKVVKLLSEKPIHKRTEIVEYYPRIRETEKMMDHLRNYGLYRDEHKDFKEEYDRLRALRGKPKWIIPKYRNKAQS